MRRRLEAQRKGRRASSSSSAGSSAVAPYTEEGARFPLEASQFEVIDQRPFEAILREHLDAGIAVESFAPPA